MEGIPFPKFENARQNLLRSRCETEPYPVEVCGILFYAHPEVFSPKYFKSTEILNTHFPFVKNERFLEVGCGIGVTSVLAALRHTNRVVCVDINPFAVQLARKNAILHNVSYRMDIRESDVFSSLSEEERFDTLYWDLPFVHMPSDYRCRSRLERAVCDPGYSNIERFLKNAPKHLAEKGRILIGFGSNGDMELLRALAEKYRYRVEEIFRKFIPDRGGLAYMLLQLVA